jgi:hypothetical protein
VTGRRFRATGAFGILLLVWLLVFCRPVGASVGGPELVDVLGWSASEHAAYVRVTHVNESGEHPWIVRMRVRSSVSDTLAWSRGSEDEASYSRHVTELRQRLSRLEELLTTTFPSRLDIVHHDSLRNGYGNWGRYRVRVSDFGGFCEGTIEAITYNDPAMRLLRVYRVPESERMVGIVSFFGLPLESGYEVQSAVILPERNQFVRIPEVRPY